MAKGLEWLTKINDFLEQVPLNLLKYFNVISKSAEEMGQTQVDIICRWLAWKVNLAVERKRQEVIKSLYDQYGGMLKMMQTASVVKRVVSDPIGALGDFIGIFTGPIATVISFVKTLLKEIPRLASNLANIMSVLPPQPPTNISINYNAFKLQIGTISIGEIIAGPDAMKSPEEMFPEPTKPFSKAAFNESFDKAKAITADEKIVWKLPKFRKTSNDTSGGESTTSDIA